MGAEPHSSYTPGTAGVGLTLPAPSAVGIATSTGPCPTPALVGQEEQGTVCFLSDELEEEDVDILGVDIEGEDLPSAQVCVGENKEEQEQPFSSLSSAPHTGRSGTGNRNASRAAPWGLPF